jgi:hypothetical protein
MKNEIIKYGAIEKHQDYEIIVECEEIKSTFLTRPVELIKTLDKRIELYKETIDFRGVFAFYAWSAFLLIAGAIFGMQCGK